MSPAEYAELREDIKQHGLLEPITLCEGKILDGRHRYRACQQLGIKPKFRQFRNGSALDYVVSLNLKRRHLTASQRAMIALDALPLFEQEAKQRQVIGGKGKVLIPEPQKGQSRDQVASLFNVAPKYVSDAKCIKKNAPKLAEQIRLGKKTITEAKRELKHLELWAARRQTKFTKAVPLNQLPENHFVTIYADPPWQFENQTSNGAAINHYHSMSLKDICQLSINRLTKRQSHLWIWAPSAMLKEALTVIYAWGFEYKSSMIWYKTGSLGTGNYVRLCHELLLIATKGNLSGDSTTQQSVIQHQRLKHSEKPEIFRKIIQAISPPPYLELFGRKLIQGWTVWGNEVSKS